MSKFQKHLRFLFVKLHRDPFAWAPCQSEEFYKKMRAKMKSALKSRASTRDMAGKSGKLGAVSTEL